MSTIKAEAGRRQRKPETVEKRHLREENERLRELVVELSSIIVRSIVADRKPVPVT
jgi:hypothetical protein